MKAMFVHGPHDVRLAELPKPEPGPGEVLVRIKSVGICGSDIHAYELFDNGGVTIASPLILGHESAGVVEALGPGVKGPAVGTPVAVDPSISCEQCEFCLEGDPHVCQKNRFFGVYPTHGALREYLTHPAHLVFPLAEGLSVMEGALLEPMGIAMYVTELADIRLGDRVAVLGSGPIGLMTTQLVRLSGAAEIIATDVVPERVKAAPRFGADIALDASREDVVARIMDHTKGRGVDVVIHATDVEETVDQAMAIAKPAGTVVMVGIPHRDQVSFRHSPARRKGLTIKFDRRMKHTYPRCMALVQAGRVDVKPIATHHFPLERLADGLEMASHRRGGALKVMIDV